MDVAKPRIGLRLLQTATPAWAAVSFFVWALLPFAREGRRFVPFDYAYHPLALGPGLHWALPFAAALILGLYLFGPGLGIAPRKRGDIAFVLAGLGSLGPVWWLLDTGTPFGWGAMLGVLAMVTAAGAALSDSGRIRGDAFVGASILLMLVFVTLFITVPLFMVMRSAVWIEGGFTLAQFGTTFSSSLFLFVNNPYTEVAEGARVGLTTGLGVLAGVGFGVWHSRGRSLGRRVAGGLIWAVIGAAAGWAIGIMVWGRGALPSTLLVSVIVAPSATMLGFVLALLGQRTQSRTVRGVLGVASVLPFITPPFVIGFSMIFLFGRRGLVTYDILGIAPAANPIYGIVGVSVAQILGLAPVAYLIIRGSLSSLNPALEEAATTLGSSRWRVFKDITWPLVRPGIAASLLLASIESIADFGTPLVLGGDRNFLATEVFLALTGRYSQSEAAVYGVVLLALVGLIFIGSRVMLGVKGFTTVTGKPASGAFLRLPPSLEAGLTALALFWFSLIAALYLAIFYGSFVQIWGINNSLTFKHYADFWQQGWPTVWTTVKLSFYSAVPAMMIGGLIAYLVTRHKFYGRGYLEFGSLLSFATPGTVMGLAYILAFNDGALLMTGTSAIIVLALVFRNMPVAIRASMSGLSQIDRSLEEASATLKAGSGITMVKILAPLLLYPLLAGLIFAFVSAMTAVSQVIFLVGAGNNLATVLLLSWVEQGRLGRAAAMATVLILGLLSLIVLLMVVSRRVDARNRKKENSR
jgi:iron(III) transport system permease protein